ncbi:hypothetical protein BC941DRAFT_427107 [Chlamydoabsidia padenii]|nr:hypothetical protein BC941DRAFT_427107 [Chlamydoabsidia padenii]
MASLETQKQQAPPLDMSGEIKSEKNQPPQAPPTALSGPLHHPTASVTPVTENLDTPPCPPNVTEWLSKQQAYQQHDDLMDTKEQQDEPLGNHDPFTMKQPAAFKEDETDQLPSKVYEDILRYLDTYSDIGNDIGLQQDITCILSPLDYQQQPNGRAKSTWSSSSSSITSSSSLSTPSYDGYYWRAHHSSSSVYHQMRLYSLLANHGMTRLSRYLLDGIKKGLSWCKFLSVLSIALLISLGRGPNHMLLSLDDLDYLEWLADQEDGYVDSYCL